MRIDCSPEGDRKASLFIDKMAVRDSIVLNQRANFSEALRLRPQIRDAVEAMYDPIGIGVAHIPNILPQPFVALLRNEARAFKRRGMVVKDSKAWGMLRLTRAMTTPAISNLREAYIEMHNNIAEIAPFHRSAAGFETEIIGYTPCEGIDWHQDSTRYVNLIGLFTIEGRADFQVKFDGIEVAYRVQEGDLMLMRSNRVGERRSLLDSSDVRPSHGIDNTGKIGRLVIAFRQVNRNVVFPEGYFKDT